MNNKSVNWENHQLAPYYENLPIEEFIALTKIGGFDQGCDIELVHPHIKSAKTILDAGAGYGRVSKKILTYHYPQKITAIERCPKFCDYMKTMFGDKVSVIQADLQAYHFTAQFDVILFMWSNIAEYPQNQQANIIKRLKKRLNPKGKLILDTIDHTLYPKNASAFHQQTYMVKSEYGVAYGYNPSQDEIKDYANTVGFIYIEQFPYLTLTQRKRFIHILG